MRQQIVVHPEFDGAWFVTLPYDLFVERPTLRELQIALGGAYRIEGYYPSGYGSVMPWPATELPKKLPPIFRQRVTRPARPASPGKSGPAPKYDHEAILNMWARGQTGPQIAKTLGIPNWKRVGQIVSVARHCGDKRAESRSTCPRWRV